MTTVGYASIPVIPSFKGFQQAIGKELSGSLRPLSRAAENVGESIGASLADGVKGAGLADLGRDAASFTRDLERAERDVASLTAELKEKRTLEIDTGDLEAKLARAKQEVASAKSALEQKIRLDLDTGSLATQGERAGSDLGGGVTEGLSSKSSEISSVITGVVASAGVAAGVLAGVAIVDGISDAIQRGVESDLLAAQVGIFNPDEQQRLGAIAGGLYADAFGESVGEINDTLRAILTTNILPEDAGDAELRALAEKFLNFQTTFSADATETARAVATLVRTGLVGGVDEAFDLLTRGFQETGDPAQDLLDTVNEYSTQFRKLGLGGAAALGLLDQGFDAGARDLDIVADAFKEFSIRAVDGTELTAQGFAALGLDAREMAERIGAGGESAASALDETLDKLRAIEDPVKRSQTAVALFGTQAEDLGDALFALDPSEAAARLGKLDSAAVDTGNVLNDNLGTALESIRRKLEPGSLLAAFQTGGFEGVKSQLSAVVDELSALWDRYGTQALDALGRGWDALMEWWNANGETRVLAPLRTWWDETGAPALSSILTGVFQSAGTAAAAVLTSGEFWGTVFSIWKTNVLTQSKVVVDALKWFAGIAVESWWGIVTQVPTHVAGLMFEAYKAVFLNPLWWVLNTMIDLWNSLDFGVSIPYWVPFIGGRSIDDVFPDVPRLPKLHSGGMIPGNANDEMLAILQGGERVLSRSEVAAGSTGAGFSVGAIMINETRNPRATAEQTVRRFRDMEFLIRGAA